MYYSWFDLDGKAVQCDCASCSTARFDYSIDYDRLVSYSRVGVGYGIIKTYFHF